VATRDEDNLTASLHGRSAVVRSMRMVEVFGIRHCSFRAAGGVRSRA
jgi:hypothetical protein